MTAPSKYCRSCRIPLGRDVLLGLCPRCMLQSGLNPTAADAAPEETELHPPPARPTPTAAARRPRRLGDYELLEELAPGGMGVVYRARQISLNRIVAIKTILLGPHASPDAIHRFRREAGAVAALQHPGIVAIHELGQVDELHFISMEFVDGMHLADKIRGNPLPPARAARYTIDIAEAIHHAHERGILHRDLKPSNILIDTLDHVRITDFGLAKRLDGAGDLTLTGQMIGSPGYFSPEQAAGQHRQLTPASDVYSIGAILFELLTGRPPFLAQSLQDTLLQIRSTDPVALRILNPSIQRDLETICLKCLEKAPARRYPDAMELAVDLRRFLDSQPIRARPVSGSEKAVRWLRRNPSTAALLASLALVLASATAISSWLALRAMRAEKQARLDAAISREINQFFNEDILEAVSPFHGGTRDIRLADVLKRAANHLDQRTFDQPLVEAAIRSSVGQALQSLTDLPAAEIHLRRSHDILLARSGPADVDRLRAATHLAILWHQLGKTNAAESLLAEVHPLLARTRGGENPDTLRALGQWVNLRTARIGPTAESLDLLRHNLATLRRALGTSSWMTRNAMSVLANLHIARGEFAEAHDLLQEAVHAAATEHSPDHTQTFWPRLGLADLFARQTRWADAERTARELLQDQEPVLPPSHGLRLGAHCSLAVACRALGRFAEAADHLLEAWDHADPGFQTRLRPQLEEVRELCRTHALAAHADLLDTRLSLPGPNPPPAQGH